ncbi:ABC transporter permease [Amycolatopsis rhabdoformis]|uniref:ABC transporter permease n=1 Tax=Amycolatopsis rhabdoformis TaxID=1448059 RepID=A0ABZ1IDC1_9PSEU|nr:ABC transporter permease [Amycolatopsis rhabdoformis]WSE32461.1 ABC transporter permease [Amycolatopsis rhabdoformis]
MTTSSPTTARGPGDVLTATAPRRHPLSALPGWVLSSCLALLLLGAWEAVVRVFSISPLLVPAPTAVAQALIAGLADGTLLAHTWVTLQEILLGFAVAVVAAMVLAFLVTQSRLVDKAFFPLVVTTQTIPKVAIAPLLLIWFGTGMTSKVVTTALLVFFPLLVNAILGLRATDPEQITMFRSFGATRWQIFRKLQVPTALPSIFAGFDLGVVFAVTGAVVAEFVGSTEGLGYVIQATNFTLDVATTFAVLVMLSVIGLVLHALVVGIGRRVVFWSAEERSGAER